MVTQGQDGAGQEEQDRKSAGGGPLMRFGSGHEREMGSKGPSLSEEKRGDGVLKNKVVCYSAAPPTHSSTSPSVSLAATSQLDSCHLAPAEDNSA